MSGTDRPCASRLRVGSEDAVGLCGLRPPDPAGLDWPPAARSRLWRIRSASPDRLTVLRSLCALAVRAVSCCCVGVCVICVPWDGAAICPAVGLCGVCCCVTVPDCALNRSMRELSGVLTGADGVGFWVTGGLTRLVDGPATFDPPEGWLCLDAASLFRRAWRRSNSDPRDTLVLSETLGEDA